MDHDRLDPPRPADPWAIRRAYGSGELSEGDLAETWLAQLQRWYAEAAAFEGITEPNAMQVATVGADGRPDLRTVLARGFDEHGIVFYTNYESAKAVQLAAHPSAAGLFSWLPLERQVRWRGPVRKVSREQTERYFAGRPRDSQLGAWASPQSRVIAGRGELDERVARVRERFGAGPIEPPPFWGGYLIEVQEMEFWQGRQSRLHDRLRYRCNPADGAWTIERLAP